MATWTAEQKTLQGDAVVLLEQGGGDVLLENGTNIILEQSSPGIITWTAVSRSSSTWSMEQKTNDEDFVGTEDTFTLLTENLNNIQTEQQINHGVTWYSVVKS